MNSDWLGDSCDFVKWFFIRELQSIRCSVYVDPMATGDWGPRESQLLELLGALDIRNAKSWMASALLLNPNTGMGVRATRDHASIAKIAAQLGQHEVVFVFDQSLRRGAVRFRNSKGNFGI